MKHVLIIEDDSALAQGIAIALESEVLEVSIAKNIFLARQYMECKEWNLLILDINLPDGNGLDFLTELRKTNSVKVILLTANDMETDIVSGLMLGADDYITKPFSLAVLRARVSTQLKEYVKREHNIYEQDDFIFSFDEMTFRKKDSVVELSKTEQKLLWMLISNRGKIVERGNLIDRLWTDGLEYVDENALSVTVKRLRDKLEDVPSKPKYIKTVYGIGYMWKVSRDVD